MRVICLAVVLWAGCKADDPIILPTNVDLAHPSDLAWTDLAGDVDIAEPAPKPDLATPVDLYPAVPWQACATIPDCGPAPFYKCCNEAPYCVGGKCLSLKGYACNESDQTRYKVLCADSHCAGATCQ